MGVRRDDDDGVASDRVESYSGPARSNPPPPDEDVLEITDEPSHADSDASYADGPEVPPAEVSLSEMEVVDVESGPRSVEQVVSDLQAIAMEELERLELEDEEDEEDDEAEDAAETGDELQPEARGAGRDEDVRDIDDEAESVDSAELDGSDVESLAPDDDQEGAYDDQDGAYDDQDGAYDDQEGAYDDQADAIDLTKKRRFLPKKRPALPGRVARHRSSAPPPKGSDPPSLGSLQQTTLASMPPPAGMPKPTEPDEMLTDSRVYEEMFESMAPPVRVPLDIDLSSEAPAESIAPGAGSEPPDAPDSERVPSTRRSGPPKSSGKKRRKNRSGSAPPKAAPRDRGRDRHEDAGDESRAAVASQGASVPPGEDRERSGIWLASALAFCLGILATLGTQRIMAGGGETPVASANEPTTKAARADGEPTSARAATPAAPEPPSSTAGTNRPEGDAVVTGVEPTDIDAIDTSGPMPSVSGPMPTGAFGDLSGPEPESEPEPKPEPKPKGPGPFDKAAAQAAVGGAAAAAAAGCGNGVNRGRAPMQITFAPSGRVTVAVLAGSSPLAGTGVGSCIANTMRSAIIPPFQGGPQTVTKTVVIP